MPGTGGQAASGTRRVARTSHLQNFSAAEIAAGILEFAPKHVRNELKWLAVFELKLQKDKPSLQSLVVGQAEAVAERYSAHGPPEALPAGSPRPRRIGAEALSLPAY